MPCCLARFVVAKVISGRRFQSWEAASKRLRVERRGCQGRMMKTTMEFRVVGLETRTGQRQEECAGQDSSGFSSFQISVYIYIYFLFPSLCSDLTNPQLSAYALVALIFCLLTWFNIWTHADIVRVGNHLELVLSTVAASLAIFTSLVGWAGILLNNRAFLAWYTFLLWVTFAFIVAPGYITYKKYTFNLEGKINAQWSRALGTAGRLKIQDQLDCCGYFNPFVEATVSQTCYSRSILPGCKAPYIKYEQRVLERWYTVVFSIVPFHLIIMVAALLCSNHVTYRFGKGMMPKAYRLSMDSMGIIMESYSQCVFPSFFLINF